MRIEHLAIWVEDLEKMKTFYLKFFQLKCNEKYTNPKKQFSSYFLAFESGPRIELMHKPGLVQYSGYPEERLGLVHFAISLGSREKVDELTERIRESGFRVIGEPRTTGDGYYESVILDPEGNLIELTV